jgi:16S rRNA (guanine527-N7)-methyltransferase
VLVEWRRARHLGFLGPGAVEDHLRHAAAFRQAVPEPARALDLGSGGGVPGLALATWWPGSCWVLLDAGERRAVFLADAVQQLGMGHRVTVRHGAAEDAARDDQLRGSFDLVVARSFGSPAVVAECAASFLVVDGRLAVSEPPSTDPTRWPTAGLEPLGLQLETEVRSDTGSIVVLCQRRPAPDDVPRRTGVPARRPRW